MLEIITIISQQVGKKLCVRKIERFDYQEQTEEGYHNYFNDDTIAMELFEEKAIERKEEYHIKVYMSCNDEKPFFELDIG